MLKKILGIGLLAGFFAFLVFLYYNHSMIDNKGVQGDLYRMENKENNQLYLEKSFISTKYTSGGNVIIEEDK